jgi:hypothetical protein
MGIIFLNNIIFARSQSTGSNIDVIVYVNAPRSEVYSLSLQQKIDRFLKSNETKALFQALEFIWDMPKLSDLASVQDESPITLLPTRIEPPKLTPFLRKDHEIIIKFLDSSSGSPRLITIREAQLQIVSFRVNGEEVDKWEPVQEELNQFEVKIPLERIKKVETNSRVDIIARFGNNITKSHNFIYFRPQVGYSIANQESYLWFPLSIFSTNFKSEENGIPFAPTPITVAFGFKSYYPRSNNYFGFSGIGGFVWTADKENNQDSGTANQIKILSKAAFGVLIDLSGYFYFGPAYVADFRKDFKDPGFVLVVGIGPRLLEFLK